MEKNRVKSRLQTQKRGKTITKQELMTMTHPMYKMQMSTMQANKL